MPWVGVGFQTLTCTRPPGPQDHLQFPDVPDVPASAQDLIRQLLCHQEARLGRRGLDDFRNHPFFASSAKTRGFHTQLDEGPETP